VTAIDRWRRQLEARAIPQPILDAAPESPWGFPAELFETRALEAASRPATPTTLRAREALPDGGSVIDVGCGGGATSLPLASAAAVLIGVDGQRDMLDAFERGARAAGVAEVRTIHGSWPEVADETPVADVLAAGHVLYNVSRLEPFARAADLHASRRVVFEITDRHPLAWSDDLWMRFHGVERPDGPDASTAEAALRELGLPVERESRVERSAGGFARREAAVALIRRRLCLAAERDDEVADALGDRLSERDGRWSAGPPEQGLVTLWWDVRR